ncbi:MAG: type III-B CRISPR module-associated protein Cmr5 [Desulfobacteraceae bacterium 4484_190.1]|nr:MAG: type III-B CRISPR module-associated protein Cmr5 [Desulfobacteraceae bacterium 4484_190.1]
MRTLGQKRAQFALEKVMAIPEGTKKKFEPFSKGAPSMILQNGFGQTLAFWASKAKDNNEHTAMLSLIKEWLSYSQNDIHNDFVPRTKTNQEFFQAISTMSQSKYLAAQNETLALLEWVKRFANAGF